MKDVSNEVKIFYLFIYLFIIIVANIIVNLNHFYDYFIILNVIFLQMALVFCEGMYTATAGGFFAYKVTFPLLPLSSPFSSSPPYLPLSFSLL